MVDRSDGPAEVADDEDRPAGQPVHPRPGRQREQDERQDLDRPEDRHLERRRLEDQDATSGIARGLICEPNSATVSADHSLRKSGWRNRLRLGVGPARGHGPSIVGGGGEARVAVGSGEFIVERLGVDVCQAQLRAGRLSRYRRARSSNPSPTLPRAAGPTSSTTSPTPWPRRPGVHLLDRTSDASHNRTVLTLAGEADAVTGGAGADVGSRSATSTWRRHTGEHPRIGAVDVIPFVPLGTPPWTTRRPRAALREADRRALRPARLPLRARPRPGRTGSASPTSAAASTRASRRDRDAGRDPTSGRRGCTRAPVRWPSAPGRSSSPGTSTSSPRTSTSPSGSPAASGNRAAACRGPGATASGSRSSAAPRSR